MLKINNLSFEKFLKNLEIGVSIFVVSFLLEFAVCLFFFKESNKRHSWSDQRKAFCQTLK